LCRRILLVRIQPPSRIVLEALAMAHLPVQDPKLFLRPIQAEDLDAVAALVGRAMNADEEVYARNALAEHFEARRMGFHDGRNLYVLPHEGRIIAVTGLHFYSWGPPENVWLSWFAVDPSFQGIGLGKALLVLTAEIAREQGRRKLLVETYSSPAFERARRFYASQGFSPAGGVRDYMADGADMVVYSRLLQ
jgi:GNAT superfamily N-acetyltransferase